LGISFFLGSPTSAENVSERKLANIFFMATMSATSFAVKSDGRAAIRESRVKTFAHKPDSGGGNFCLPVRPKNSTWISLLCVMMDADVAAAAAAAAMHGQARKTETAAYLFFSLVQSSSSIRWTHLEYQPQLISHGHI
jgi:hypothetical protein